MNRRDEYFNLLTELEETPAALEYTMARAESRLRGKKRSRFFLIPIGSIVSFFILFTVFVNCSLTFAYACGRIPLIKDLARFVAASPSLSAAVENEYVQPIEMQQENNGIIAKIEYVIVDQKQLAVFYTLDSSKYSDLDATPEIRNDQEEVFEGYSISSDSFGENNELRKLTIDFMEGDMPDTMYLRLAVRDNGEDLEKENLEIETDQEKEDMYAISPLPEPVATFNFKLTFDPFFTAQGKVISLNKEFCLDGQNLTLSNMEVYPTHIRLNFSDDQKNTAWLKALNFYLINEKGKRFESIADGITATGSTDSPMMPSHRLESTYFSKSKALTLYITGVTWLDKDMEKVRINLKEKTAEALPQNVTFAKAERQGNDWIVGFGVESIKENHVYQVFGQNYYDEEGTEYSYDSWSSTSGDSIDSDSSEAAEKQFYTEFPLRNYPFDVVYLSPDYSRMVKLEKPIKIQLDLTQEE